MSFIHTYCVTVTNGIWEQPITVEAEGMREAFRKAEAGKPGFTATHAFIIDAA